MTQKPEIRKQAKAADTGSSVHSAILHFDTALEGMSAGQTVLQSMMLNKGDKRSLCSSDKDRSNPFKFGKSKPVLSSNITVTS